MLRSLSITGAAALFVGGIAASGPVHAGQAVHARPATQSVTPLIAGQASGGGCSMGYDTQTATLTPPDDSTSDNPPAGVVTINKPCPGAVVGNFTSEVNNTVAGDFIHIAMRATCIGPAGMTDPCTVGSQFFAHPGTGVHIFMRSTQGSYQTHSVQGVWTGLKRGRWKFEVLPGGNNSADLVYRSFVVEAFSGG
jgi:hypothetical protein